MPARRIRIEVASDKSKFIDAALELRNRILRRNSRALRQLAHRDEVLRIEIADAIDQIIAVLGPVLAGGFISDVVAHHGSPRRKDGDIRAALPLKLQLGAFEA